MYIHYIVSIPYRVSLIFLERVFEAGVELGIKEKQYVPGIVQDRLKKIYENEQSLEALLHEFSGLKKEDKQAVIEYAEFLKAKRMGK